MSTFMDFLTGGIQSIIPQTVEETAPNVTAGEQPRAARPSGNPFAELFASTEQQYGLPAGYLERTARVESSFNPSAKNPNSSAGGLFQFVDGTAKQYGLANRYDPLQATDAAARLARDNAAILKRTLGREPTAGELYLAHQQGAGGAVKLLSNPDAPAEAIVGPAAAKLNGGAGLTAGQLAQKWTAKIDGAGGGDPPANRALAYAAERGRGPAADRPARGAAIVEGQMPMARQMPPDLSNSPDGGAREFLLQQAGMSPDMQPSGPQGGGQSLVQMLMGAVGGGGQPARQPDSIEALIPDNKPNPFAFMGEALMENQQAAQKRQGQIFAAKQLVAQGMSPQDAVAAVNSPSIGQQLALNTLGQQQAAREQAAVRQQVYGGQPTREAPRSEAPAQPGAGPAAARPADAAMLGGQPPAAPLERLTPKLTVDTLLRDREKVQREIETLYAIPTSPASKSVVDGRVKALEGRLGNIDKNLEIYGTGPLKEYTVAMRQRIDRGEALTPFEKYDPEGERKAARGPQSEEITGLRKEVQNLPSYKNMAQAAPVYNSMLEAAGRNTRSADVNLIYGMAKIMDPTSVVRESEMTVAQAIATLPDRLQQGARSLLNSEGRLSDEVRKGIMTEAYSRMNSYKGLFDTDTKQYDGIASRRQINREDVIPNFGEFKPYKPPEKQGADGATTPQFKTGATATGRDGTKIRFDGTTWVPFQ